MLLVEDDAAFAHALRDDLTRDGFMVDWATDAPHAHAAARDVAPDIALLDLTLSGGDDLCAQWRADGRFPIIVVTSRDRVEDKTTA